MAHLAEQQLAVLLREAAAAHHRAFAATNGEDREWATWYAKYLGPRLEALVGRRPDSALLAADLVAVDSEHRRTAPQAAWSDYDARWLWQRYDS